MTHLPEKLLQLEFLVKTIAQSRLVNIDDDCGTTISIRFLDHPEQRVCEIPRSQSRLDSAASVIAVNVGKRYTFAMPANCGNSCDPKPVNVSVQLYSLRSANTRSVDLELASGELTVKPTTLSDVDYGQTTADRDDMIVPMTDCRGRPVALLSVQVRAWITGSITVTPIDSPPVCQRPSVDGCQKKSSECCNNSVTRQPTPCCRLEPTHCYCYKSPAREPTYCCNKPSTREPTYCCKKPPARKPTSCYKIPPAREPTSCCSDPLTRKPRQSCCDKPPVRDPCHRQCSGMDMNEQRPSDQLQWPYADTEFGINDQKIDLSVCNQCDVQRRITQEADAFISKIVFMVNDMHAMAKGTADIVD